jgi:stage II sporulation protein D
MTRPTYHRISDFLAIASTLAILGLSASGGASAATLQISGGGDGHGVGMSQDGALGYAEHGYGYQAILAHYYLGTTIAQAPANRPVRVLIHNHVHRIALETYVRGVVSAEVSGDWPTAALEAQAVASRTYALTANAGNGKFDVYSDDRSQVYRPSSETPQGNAAVAATAGQIVTYEGRPAITYFFASSGGMTESVQNSFPGAAAEPWLRGVTDPFDQGPLHSWTTSMSFASAAKRLRGLVHGSFRGIEVLKRGYSPRILSAYVVGSGGRAVISGPDLAARLGLYDTWAYFSVHGIHGTRPEPDLSGYSTPPPTSEPTVAPSPAPAPTPVPIAGGASAPRSSHTGTGGGTAAG